MIIKSGKLISGVLMLILLIISILMVFNLVKFRFYFLSLILFLLISLAYSYYIKDRWARKKTYSQQNKKATSLCLNTIINSEDEISKEIYDSELLWEDFVMKKKTKGEIIKFYWMERNRYIGKLLNLDNNVSNWLDIGCNDGYIQYLHNNGSVKLYGIDVSLNRLHKAKERFNNKGIEFCGMQASGESLPFKKNSFDRITLTDVIEHIPKWDKCLEEIYRTSKKKGALIITTPNAVCFGFNPFGIFHAVLGRKFSSLLGVRPLVTDPGSPTKDICLNNTGKKRYIFHRDFTPDEIRSKLKRVGLKIQYSGSLPGNTRLNFLDNNLKKLQWLFKMFFYLRINLLAKIPLIKYSNETLVFKARK